MQLRDQLRDTKKLDSSVTVYFNKLKTISDTVTSIGQPLCSDEFQSIVLAGLDEEYENLVNNIVGRETGLLPTHALYPHLL
jgi:hypothetical protein